MALRLVAAGPLRPAVILSRAAALGGDQRPPGDQEPLPGAVVRTARQPLDHDHVHTPRGRGAGGWSSRPSFLIDSRRASRQPAGETVPLTRRRRMLQVTRLWEAGLRGQRQSLSSCILLPESCSWRTNRKTCFAAHNGDICTLDGGLPSSPKTGCTSGAQLGHGGPQPCKSMLPGLGLACTRGFDSWSGHPVTVGCVSPSCDAEPSTWALARRTSCSTVPSGEDDGAARGPGFLGGLAPQSRDVRALASESSRADKESSHGPYLRQHRGHYWKNAARPSKPFAEGAPRAGGSRARVIQPHVVGEGMASATR